MAKPDELVKGTRVVVKAYAPMGEPEKKGVVHESWSRDTETVIVLCDDGEMVETTAGGVRLDPG